MTAVKLLSIIGGHTRILFLTLVVMATFSQGQTAKAPKSDEEIKQAIID
jgi:hypothetical protein